MGGSRFSELIMRYYNIIITRFQSYKYAQDKVWIYLIEVRNDQKLRLLEGLIEVACLFEATWDWSDFDCDCIEELIVEIAAPPIPTPLRGLLLTIVDEPAPYEIPTSVLFTIITTVLLDWLDCCPVVPPTVVTAAPPTPTPAFELFDTTVAAPAPYDIATSLLS
jgi:hypothetical protein